MAADYYQAWLDARAVVRAARDVIAEWPSGGTTRAVETLRTVTTAYDQRNHDTPPPLAAAPATGEADVAPAEIIAGKECHACGGYGGFDHDDGTKEPCGYCEGVGTVAVHKREPVVDPLPCDVRIPPGTTFGEGVPLATLVRALHTPGRPKHFATPPAAPAAVTEARMHDALCRPDIDGGDNLAVVLCSYFSDHRDRPDDDADDDEGWSPWVVARCNAALAALAALAASAEMGE